MADAAQTTQTTTTGDGKTGVADNANPNVTTELPVKTLVGGDQTPEQKAATEKAAADEAAKAAGKTPEQIATEKKAADDKAAAEAKAKEVANTVDVKAFKLPEGFKVDDKLMGGFTEILSDAKASPQERGQKLLDLYAGAVKQVGEANTKAWTDLNQKWVDEVKADAEIGGAKLEPTRQVISKAIDSLGAEGAKAFREALDVTGAGNNPALIRGLAKLAKQLTEGGHIQGSPGKGKATIKDTFYPNSPEMKD